MRDKLLSIGGKEYEPIIEQGEGFVTASVIDQFRNVLGFMYNSLSENIEWCTKSII